MIEGDQFAIVAANESRRWALIVGGPGTEELIRPGNLKVVRDYVALLDHEGYSPEGNSTLCITDSTSDRIAKSLFGTCSLKR